MDSLLLETTTIPFAEGWGRSTFNPAIDENDFNYFFVKSVNRGTITACVTKYKWVPGGESEFQSDFGDGGYSEAMHNYAGGSSPGVQTDGTYLYTVDRGAYNTEPPTDFYIFDLDGSMISSVDLQKWWSPPEDREAGGQASGGPNGLWERNSKLFLNCHCSCIKQMVDPLRFLDSGDAEDFFVWTNLNGDYVFDHNWEDTAALPWVCMDYNVGPFVYNLDADDKLFSQGPCYSGAVSFGLLAPDGTGLGYFAFAGETAGWKKESYFLDSDTPFDGIYCDNEHAGSGSAMWEWEANEFTQGIYFIGHDSITGVITSGVGVAEEAPTAFSVAQNSPNPFNPATTINFNLAEAGNVAVEIYNVAGQKVDTIADGFMNAGSHSIVWNASDFSAGVYFYTVKSGGFSKTMKMTLLK